MQEAVEVLILGAGASGLLCAAEAGRRGRRTLVLDHAPEPGKKLLISGGGRCNFTNLGASPAQYVSANPHFCKSALSRFPAERFIHKLREHGIPFHERKWGQLFCDRSAGDLVRMLKQECDEAGVEFRFGTRIRSVGRNDPPPARFTVETETGVFTAESLVVATGGLSIPKIGATGLGYDIARQFGLNLVETAPALDGFTFTGEQADRITSLTGISIDCILSCRGVSFRENVLFTHSGLSGPAALQCSLYWRKGDPISLDLLPGFDFFDDLLRKKTAGNRGLVRNLLAERLPARLAEAFCELHFPSRTPLPQVSEKELQRFCERLHQWTLFPSGTVGYSKAEVTRGGVDTAELSSKTMESRKVPGLYFIGEVVDVTGWLGGYNLQWAWSSGWAAGQAV